jgi:hypothetical protein
VTELVLRQRSQLKVVRANDLGLSCASNMVAPRSEVQAELCGPARLPRQLQTRVRWQRYVLDTPDEPEP